MTIEDKKRYLVNGSLLYNKFTKLTNNECLRRFIAFRIIVNAMCYEDILANRVYDTFRSIRNVLLSHKQESEFFEGFKSAEYIVNSNVTKLLDFMITNLSDSTDYEYFKELKIISVSTRIDYLLKKVFDKFDTDYYKGFRISNNFLCTLPTQIKEISFNDLAGAFYRYNSSKELGIFTNYVLSNTGFDFELKYTNLCFKADYILHTVNMHDSIFKDTCNPHSIDGLYEVMERKNIGDKKYLGQIKNDHNYIGIYRELRNIRNHSIGHIDRRMTLDEILEELDKLDIQKAFDFNNQLDQAIKQTAKTHIAIHRHASVNTFKVTDPKIIEVKGLANVPYFDT